MTAGEGPPDGDPVRVLAELVQTMSIESQRLSEVFAGGQDMNATDMEALVHLMRAQRVSAPLSPGSLAERLGISPSAVTSVIDRLERHHHLHRERDLGDRRRVFLIVDDGALDLAAAFFGPLARRTADALEPFSSDELTAAARVMSALIDAMREHRLQLGPHHPG